MTPDTEVARPNRVQARVRFEVLGPLTVTEGEQSFNLGGVKQRTVLAMLIAHAGDPVSIDAIIEAVWGEETPSTARRNTQTYVATLRGQVGDVIEKTTQGWKLVVDRRDIDALAFEDLFLSASDSVESNPERASVALREALAMWRGHPYADIESHGILDGETTRLSEMRLSAQATRIDADLALGRHSELIGEIEALTVEHPYSERFRAQHMLALYRSGRQEESLRSYQRLRTTLLDELGVDPTPELQDLEAKILQQDESLAPSPSNKVQRRAILVADPGDPIEIGHLPAEQRTRLLESTTDSIERALAANGGGTSVTAGATTFVILDQAESAAQIAQNLVDDLDGSGVRIAIDWGDVVVGDDAVSGAPVSRAAVMAAVGHRGQVLLSSEAQQAIAAGGGKTWRYESLGAQELHGVEDEVLLYQLLLGVDVSFPPLDLDRLPPPLPGGGNRSIPGYELREPIGQGSIGTLYRAFQPSVGREVLVEVIGRAESSDLGFVRNFEADAQRLSLLDHQNIAQVIDYWRQPDGAFLVYRFPRGGFLSAAAGVEANRAIDQIGAGLSHAHSFGMVHGSLRPDRVVLDEAGNASIIGFAIAGVPPRSSPDYPAYIVPEALAGEPATAATDIYALAVLANELMTGESPEDGLVEPAHQAIAQSLSERPGDRHRSVADFLVDLNPTAADDPADRYTDTRNPYKGLAAFQERDAGDFYGRAAAIEDLVSALTDSSLMAVVGPSGIGKSSVVRAGLIPMVRAGAIQGSETWVIADMLPGSQPFLELQKALTQVAADVPVSVTESLVGESPGALEHVDRILPEGALLLLLIDQFEELFTMTGEETRRAFLELIMRAVDQGSARIIVTLRADFLDRPLRYSGFGDMLSRATVMLRAPKPDELEEAIVRPAAAMGVEFDSAVVERMVSDVHDQPGALPLLQHALTAVFERRSTDQIGLEEYDAVGGVTGSLADRAEAVYSSLEEAHQHVAKQVLLRLVTVLEDAAPTRRRVRVSELDDIAADSVIAAFTRNRLLVGDTDPESRTPTVEVAHEALLSHWPRYASWIDSTREDLVMRRRLAESIVEWEANDRSDAYLLSSARLAQHQEWTVQTELDINQTERDYLEASEVWNEAQVAKRRRHRRAVLAGFGIAAVVAGVLAFNAMRQRQRAEAVALASTSLAAIESDPELAVLLGIQSMEVAVTDEGSIALGQAIQSDRTVIEYSSPPDAPWAFGGISPDGQSAVVAAAFTPTVEAYSLDGSSRWTFETGDGFGAGGAAYTMDGDQVIVFREHMDLMESTIVTLDSGTGEVISEVDAPTCTIGLGSTTSGLHIDPSLPLIQARFPQVDGECVEGPSVLVTMDLASGEEEVLVEEWDNAAGTQGYPTYSNDGRRVAYAQGFGGAVLDAETGRVLLELGRGLSTLNQDGSSVLRGNDPLLLWDVDADELIREFPGRYNTAFFTPDETRIYAADVDGSMVLLDIASGRRIMELRGQGNEAISMSINDDQTLLSSASVNATVRVWDIGSTMVGDAGYPQLVAPGGGFQTSLSETSSGLILPWAEQVVVPPFRSTLFDKATFAPEGELPGWVYATSQDGELAAMQGWGEEVEMSPDQAEQLDVTPGSYFEAGGVVILDVESGELVTRLDGPCEFLDSPIEVVPGPECSEYPISWVDGMSDLGFSPDGDLIAGGGWANALVVWDAGSGEILHTEIDEEIFPFGDIRVAFSPDGRFLAYSAQSGSAPIPFRILDTTDWSVIADIGHATWISVLEFTPDGSLLLAGDNFSEIAVVNTATWTKEEPLAGQQGNFMEDIDVSPNGELVATSGFDGESWVWDLETRSVVRKWAVDGRIRLVEFLDDESLLIVPDRAPGVVVTLDPEEQLGYARSAVSRSFTPDECATYDIEPCPTLEEIRSG